MQDKTSLFQKVMDERDGRSGYWSRVCRYIDGMIQLQAFQRNAGEPQEQYQGASETIEASEWMTLGVRQRKGKLTAYLWQSDKSIVVMKAVKVAGAKGLGYSRFTHENNPKGNDCK